MNANEIVMLPIGMLAHHPDNPRKDLGDLTELTESIRQRGIMQNLTVVFEAGHTMSNAEWTAACDQYNLSPTEELRKMLNAKKIPDRYLVVIGNRRFEAAKGAGLEELPCVVSDMDHKTQVATMLAENMQRQDLTVYEQAQGFQMMMDLGFTEQEIGQKTGFSRKTVKDRLKLTKLDQAQLRSAVGNGATLIEMVEVTKIQSKEAQKEVLEAAGTDDFREKLMDALWNQEYEINKGRLVPVLQAMGLKELSDKERWSSNWIACWNDDFKLDGTEEDLRKAVGKVQADHPGSAVGYVLHEYGQSGEISFSYEKPKAEPMSAEEKTERQKAILKGKHRRLVMGYWEKAYELRKDFVKNYSVADGQSSTTLGKILIQYALSNCRDYGGKLTKVHEWNDAYVREVLGLPEEPEKRPGADEKAWRSEHFFTIWEQADGRNIPMVRIMMAWAVAGGVFWPDSPEHGLYNYDDGAYRADSGKANGVSELYDFLVGCGYRISEMEKQLLDGSHQCYRMEELDS